MWLSLFVHDDCGLELLWVSIRITSYAWLLRMTHPVRKRLPSLSHLCYASCELPGSYKCVHSSWVVKWNQIPFKHYTILPGPDCLLTRCLFFQLLHYLNFPHLHRYHVPGAVHSIIYGCAPLTSAHSQRISPLTSYSSRKGRICSNF